MDNLIEVYESFESDMSPKITSCQSHLGIVSTCEIGFSDFS